MVNLEISKETLERLGVVASKRGISIIDLIDELSKDALIYLMEDQAEEEE